MFGTSNDRDVNVFIKSLNSLKKSPFDLDSKNITFKLLKLIPQTTTN